MVEVLEHELFDAVAQLRRERDGTVFVLDELFDQLCRHRLALAGGDLARPARADQIEILRSPTISGLGDHQPRTAGAAVDAATQVVIVGALMCSCGGMG